METGSFESLAKPGFQDSWSQSIDQGGRPPENFPIRRLFWPPVDLDYINMRHAPRQTGEVSLMRVDGKSLMDLFSPWVVDGLCYAMARLNLAGKVLIGKW
jgi:hypothetical protein